MKLIKLLAYFFTIFLVLEIGLRLAGIRPFPHFDNAETEKIVEKNFRDYMCNDDSIGIIPCASKERTIYQSDKIPFRISHLPDGSRFCGSDAQAADTILITGDSNTHGDGVNDSNHVGFLLQQMLPAYRVINRAIPGSGNVSQLQVLKESLRHYTPEIVIATYGSYHNDRNIFSRSIRKAFRLPKSKAAFYKFPCASLVNGRLNVEYAFYHYTPVPFSNRSAIFEAVNLLIEKQERYEQNAELVTLKVWEAYVALCKLHHIKLCVVATTQDEATDRLCNYFKQNQVEIIPVRFPDEMTFKPIDSHPNSAGHRYFASCVHKALSSSGWLKK